MSRATVRGVGVGVLCVLAGCSANAPEISTGSPWDGPQSDNRATPDGEFFGGPFASDDGGMFGEDGGFATGQAGANAAAVAGTADSPAAPGDTAAPRTPAGGWNAGAVSLGAGFGWTRTASSGSDPVTGAVNAQPVSTTGEGDDFDPSVSIDGSTVVFASTRHSPSGDIYRKRVGGTSVVQITNDPAHDVMPVLSPDGERVAFASDRDGSWDIFVVGVNGGPAVQVTDGVETDLHPTWAPDGRTLAFCRLGQGRDRWEIWTVEVDRPATTRFLTEGMFPDWQPGGNKLAFQRSRNRGGGHFTVWTVDIVDGEAHRPTEIVSSTKGAVINPAWSHDGTRIAFSTVLNEHTGDSENGPTRADLWVQGIDGSGRVNLTRGEAVNLMPSWGPDGTLFFVTDRTGRDTIWAIPAGDPAAGTGSRVASQPVPMDGE